MVIGWGATCKINSTYTFDRDEEGRVKTQWAHNVEELDGSYLTDNYGGDRDYGDEILVQDDIDIFYYGQQYVEYGAEIVDKNILEEYENYDEILQVIAEAFDTCSYIGDAPAYLYGMMSYYVQDTELDHVRKSVNDVYYLNYKVYGRRLGWDSLDFFDQYSKECDVWAYAVLEATGSQLEFKRIIFGKREEFADIGLPVYYGPDRELVYMEGNAE